MRGNRGVSRETFGFIRLKGKSIFHLVLLMCYADIAKMTRAMFGCVSVEFGNQVKNLLFVDFRFDCDSDYHSLWIKKFVSPVMIMFCVWDVVILMRKLLLIFINSFFFSRITDQVEFYPILIVIMVFAAAFGLQTYFKPFARKEFNIINGIEEYSLLVSFYTTLIALVYMITDELGPNATLGLLLLGLFMNISFFAFWIRLYIKYNDSLLNIRKLFIRR